MQPLPGYGWSGYQFSEFMRVVMAKEKVINIRVEAEFKKKAKKLAEADGRSLSNWILKLIKNEIRKAPEVAQKPD